MKNLNNVVILCGGQSGEREVSLKSALPVFDALKNLYKVRSIQLDVNELPSGLDANTDLIFPLIHGDFGEDGRLQDLLEAHHFSYIGSGPKANRLCINKMASKHLAKENGLPVLPGIELSLGETLKTDEIVNALGCDQVVLKPTDKGSSIGVHLCNGLYELQNVWSTIYDGHWMLERYVKGRELTVGILQGEALGAVEICPKHGFYDFKNKYTVGACDYLYPAPIDEKTCVQLQMVAKTFFERAGCVDYGRADFLLEPNGHVWFLEMNTIPGMTEQSLFPKSAACVGIAFEDLLKRLVDGAINRFQ